VLFRTAPYVFFFPWTCEAGEEEDFFLPPVFTDSLSLLNLKKTPTQPTYLPRGGRMKETYPLGGSGRLHSGRLSHVPPLCLPIKTGGVEQRRTQKKKEGGQTKRKKKREEKQKNRRKGRKQRKRERARKKTEEKKKKERLPLSPPLSSSLTATLRLHHPQVTSCCPVYFLFTSPLSPFA
jgi:hypothetical protein